MLKLILESCSAAMVAEYSKYEGMRFTDSDGGPFCVTNHLLYEHEAKPSDFLAESQSRLSSLQATIGERKGPHTARDIRANNRSVEMLHPLEVWPSRTLWTSLWDTRARSLEIDFYLGEAEDGVRRSELYRFSLNYVPTFNCDTRAR